MTLPSDQPTADPAAPARTIPFGRPMLSDAERARVAEVLAGPQLTQGPVVREFEARFATLTGAPHAVATSSCMGALHLAWLHLGLRPGDEVIVPAQTHVATAMAVEVCGGRCVFVDCEPATGNVDVEQVETLVTPRTRGISLVHFLGMPVDMRRLAAVSHRHGLAVVEDCALALGATCAGVHVGLWGDAGAFSFYPTKHVTTGEGGMLVTTRAELAHAAARQRAFGVERSAPGGALGTDDYDVTSIGLNYRMSELAAALGAEQLRRLPGFLAARRANHAALVEALADVEELRPLGTDDDSLRSAHYCLGLVLADSIADRRADVIAFLRARGVGVSVYYPRPVPQMTYFQARYGHRAADFPVAARISTQSLALPTGPHLQAGDVERMARAVRDAVAAVKGCAVAR